jgi:hypothetical protein
MKSIAKEPMNSFGSGDGGNIVPYSGSPSFTPYQNHYNNGYIETLLEVARILFYGLLKDSREDNDLSSERTMKLLVLFKPVT